MKNLIVILIALVAVVFAPCAEASVATGVCMRSDTTDTTLASLYATADSLAQSKVDTALLDSRLANKPRKLKLRKDGSVFVPNPNRALWLSLVFPGAGQISSP